MPVSVPPEPSAALFIPIFRFLQDLVFLAFPHTYMGQSCGKQACPAWEQSGYVHSIKHKRTHKRVLKMGRVKSQGMLERHPNTFPRRGSTKTGWRQVAGHNKALPGRRHEHKARGHHPLITTNNVPCSPQLHFWIVTTSHVPPASPVAVFPWPEPCDVWPWSGILVTLRRSWGTLDKSLTLLCPLYSIVAKGS